MAWHCYMVCCANCFASGMACFLILSTWSIVPIRLLYKVTPSDKQTSSHNSDNCIWCCSICFRNELASIVPNGCKLAYGATRHGSLWKHATEVLVLNAFWICCANANGLGRSLDTTDWNLCYPVWIGDKLLRYVQFETKYSQVVESDRFFVLVLLLLLLLLVWWLENENILACKNIEKKVCS